LSGRRHSLPSVNSRLRVKLNSVRQRSALGDRYELFDNHSVILRQFSDQKMRGKSFIEYGFTAETSVGQRGRWLSHVRYGRTLE